MRWIVALLLCLCSCAPALAGVRFCNKFAHHVRFAVAYQTPEGWVTEGWVDVDPGACVIDEKHADLTDFLWTAESGVYSNDGKQVRRIWGKGKQFSVKDGPFTLKGADKKLKGARLAAFDVDAISFSDPAIVATVEIHENASTTTTVPGPNSAKSDPNFKACQDGSGDEAIAACDRAINSGKFKEAVLAEIYDDRGWDKAAKKDYESALADYAKALEINPQSSLVYKDRGDLHLEKDEYGAAIADYNKAIQLDPGYIAAYAGRGDVYQDEEKFDQAIDDYKKALSLKPNDKYRKNIEGVLASVYVMRGAGQDDQAAELADYNEALRLNPSNTGALNNRGALYNEQHDYDRAIQDLDEALKLKPNYALALRNRGDAYAGKGQADKAAADYKQALASNPSDELKQEIEEALNALGSGGNAAAPTGGTPAPEPASAPSAQAPAQPSPAEAPAKPAPDNDTGRGEVDFRDQ
jgi:tetratricopeptide (TPR) repeat protein